MKVLITGFTSIQCGRLDSLEICSFPAMVAEGVRDLGHEVEHRPTAPGEPLDGFDWALVGVASPISWTSRFALSAMDVIGRAREEGCELGFILDDWRVRNIHTNFGCVVKNPAMLARDTFASRPYFEWGVENLDRLAWLSEHMQNTVWPTTLVPAFTWGDPSILVKRTTGLRSHRFVFVDPSAYAPVHLVEPSSARTRAWVSGALTSNPTWLSRQGFTWPLHEYGHRRRGQARLKEAELVYRYGGSWGVVASPYYHAGSGWWRARFLHAALTQAVLFADPKEVAGLGPAYKHPLPELEAMTDVELAQVATEQAAELLGRQWSKEQFMAALETAICEGTKRGCGLTSDGCSTRSRTVPLLWTSYGPRARFDQGLIRGWRVLGPERRTTERRAPWARLLFSWKGAPLCRRESPTNGRDDSGANRSSWRCSTAPRR